MKGTNIVTEEEKIAQQIATVPRMPKSDLAKFVQDFVDGKLITDRHVPQDLIGQIFMPLIFGCFEEYSDAEKKNLGIVYEYYDKAGPMGINGYPMFMSLHIMHKDDWAIAASAIKKEEARRKEYLNTMENDLRDSEIELNQKGQDHGKEADCKDGSVSCTTPEDTAGRGSEDDLPAVQQAES